MLNLHTFIIKNSKTLNKYLSTWLSCSRSIELTDDVSVHLCMTSCLYHPSINSINISKEHYFTDHCTLQRAKWHAKLRLLCNEVSIVELTLEVTYSDARLVFDSESVHGVYGCRLRAPLDADGILGGRVDGHLLQQSNVSGKRRCLRHSSEQASPSAAKNANECRSFDTIGTMLRFDIIDSKTKLCQINLAIYLARRQQRHMSSRRVWSFTSAFVT